MKLSKVVGIDLGTTNSLAAVMDLTDTNIIMYSDKLGRKLTPSVVAYDPGKNEILVGHAAFRRRGTESEPIVSVKRDMATPNKKLKLGPYEKTPVEISVLILEETVKRISEELTKQMPNNTFLVNRAIITVPAYFNADQKEATCEAGRKAGLEVMEILYEPTAAAIHYSWKHNITDAIFMVYDLGGGTFDVSIIRQLHGEPQVLGIAGDNFLGGDDFDKTLANHICQIIEESEGYQFDFDIKNNPKDSVNFTKWVMFAEGIKKELSAKDVCRAENQNLGEDKKGDKVIVDMEITRDAFEKLIEEKINSTIPCCEEALKKANEKSGITLDQIDYILLVGGSTKIPLVQEKVKEAFCSGKNGRPRAKCNEPVIDEPDLAVALGAAIQAANCGLNMYDDHRVVVTLRNPGGTSRSTYNLSGEVKTLDESLNLNGGSIRVNIREGGFREEKSLGEDGKFSFKKIPLQDATINNLELTILDKDGQEVATFGRSVVQDKEHKNIGGGLISPNQLAKPLSLEIIKGNSRYKEVLFPDGTTLPAEGHFKFFTRDQSGMIRMPFYEENRVLKEIVVEDIDTSLPPGTPVEFYLHCDEKHYIEGHYKIKGEQFAIRIDPRTETPLPTREDYKKLLKHFDEATGYLSPGEKMKISGKKMKICKDIEEAFQFNDEPKLRQRIAELEGLIKDIEVRDQPLEPPKMQFDMLVQECHQLGVVASSLLKDFDLFEWQANIDTQRKFGEEAYQAKDQQRYGECYTNLGSHFQHLRDKLQDKIRGPRGEFTDEERAQGLVAELQQGIEELELLAKAQSKINLLQDLQRQAKELEKVEPLCTSAPLRVIKDGQRIHVELQKIARQLIEDPTKRQKFEGLLTK